MFVEIAVCKGIFVCVVVFSSDIATTQTPPDERDILISCPYSCGMDMICDPATKQCVSCKGYCHAKISKDCETKCPAFLMPHRINQQTTKPLAPRHDFKSAEKIESDNLTYRGYSYDYIIWIVIAIMLLCVVITVLSVISIKKNIFCAKEKQQSYSMKHHANGNKEEQSKTKSNQCIQTSRNSVFPGLEAVSGLLGVSRESNITRAESSPIIVHSHSHSSMESTSMNRSGKAVLHKSTSMRGTNTDNCETSYGSRSIQRTFPFRSFAATCLTHFTQSNLIKSHSTDCAHILGNTCNKEQEGCKIRPAHSTNDSSSFWRRELSKDNYNVQHSTIVYTQDQEQDTQLLKIGLPGAHFAAKNNEEQTSLIFEQQAYNRDGTSDNHTNALVFHRDESTCRLTNEENHTFIYEVPPRQLTGSEKTYSGINISQTHYERSSQRYNDTVDGGFPSDAAQDYAASGDVVTSTGNCVSSNIDIHGTGQGQDIYQPVDGRHYDGNDSLGSGSLNIELSIDHESTQIVCQPSDAVNEPNAQVQDNSNRGQVGSIEDHRSLLNQENDNDSHVNYIPRSMTDDSAMASMYDPEYMDRDGFHLAHINNNPIYEQLQGIPWVMGYHSEGRSISIYAELDLHDTENLQQQLVDVTGQPGNKFKLRQNAHI